MFDIAWSEMVLIGAVALVVIGPKDLPRVLRTVGQTVGKVRRMAAEFQTQFNDAMREAELADLKKQVEDVGGSVSNAFDTSPTPTPTTDYKPIEEPKDFAAPAGEVAKPDEAALKEAEAKLASLPPPAPLPPVDIVAETPAPAAEPAARPKRSRRPKPEARAEEPPAAEAADPAAAEPNGAVPGPAPAPRAKAAEAVAPGEPDSPFPEVTATEAAKPVRKRRPRAAKGEETQA